MRIFVAAVPIGTALVIGWMFYNSLNPPAGALEDIPVVGSEMPQFQLPGLLDGAVISDSDLPQEGAYLLNVWASWCFACTVEHPQFVRAQRDGVRIVGVNYRDQKDDALAWLEEHGNPYETILSDQTGALVLELGLTGVPETYLVVDNVVRYRRIGVVDETIWAEQIAPRLQQATSSQAAASP